jgi:AcrR family transcriptional regulator
MSTAARSPSLPRPARRTQSQRRSAAIARLVDATIEAISEIGYGRASVREICQRASLSQGALFRHFDSRVALIAHAVNVVGQRHLQRFATALSETSLGEAPASSVVRLIRDLCRSSDHAAWHEVMVAARTDSALHNAVAETLTAFERAIIGTVADAFDLTLDESTNVASVVLSIMHMFDSEAVTIVVRPNAAVEAARLDWAAAIWEATRPQARPAADSS